MAIDRRRLLPNGESRSDFFQRLRQLGLWDDAEEVISHRRFVHREAGMNRREAGNAAWSDATVAYPIPDPDDTRRLLILADSPPVIGCGRDTEIHMWDWILGIELVIRVASLLPMTDVVGPLMAAIDKRQKLTSFMSPDHSEKANTLRDKSLGMLSVRNFDPIPTLMERFRKVEAKPGSGDYGDAVRLEHQCLYRVLERIVELQVESSDRLSRALTRQPKQ